MRVCCWPCAEGGEMRSFRACVFSLAWTDVFNGLIDTTVYWYENIRGSPTSFTRRTLTTSAPYSMWQVDVGDVTHDGHLGACSSTASTAA